MVLWWTCRFPEQVVPVERYSCAADSVRMMKTGNHLVYNTKPWEVSKSVLRHDICELEGHFLGYWAGVAPRFRVGVAPALSRRNSGRVALFQTRFHWQSQIGIEPNGSGYLAIFNAWI